MKRYLVFAYDTYYPLGGLCDLKGQFDSVEKAKLHCLALVNGMLNSYEYCMLVDQQECKVVESYTSMGDGSGELLSEEVDTHNIALGFHCKCRDGQW